MTPYTPSIVNGRSVISHLMGLMLEENEMKRFKNIAAVYVMWQHELHNLELEQVSYLAKN